MKTTLRFALIALSLAALPLLAQDKPAHEKMKATKDCGSCCTQGGDCCDKCGHDKCAPCCEEKTAKKS